MMSATTPQSAMPALRCSVRLPFVLYAACVWMLGASASMSAQTSVDRQALFQQLAPQDPTIVTRSHTVSLFVDSARFADLPDGHYAMQLKVNFAGWNPGATGASNSTEVRVVFGELLQQGTRSERTWSANHRQLIENLSLTDKTAVTLQLSLTALSQEKERLFNTFLQPLLGKSLALAPVNLLFDNFLSSSADASDVPVFEATLQVPLNAVEYKTLAGQGRPLLKTDVPILIAAQGSAPVPGKVQGVLGLLRNVANAGSYVVSGTKVIRATPEARYSGVLGLSFSRSNNPLLPSEVLEQLNALDIQVEAISVGGGTADLEASLSQLGGLAVGLLNKKKISEGTYANLISYGKFAKAYASTMRNMNNWKAQFKSALQEASTIGLAFGTKIYYVQRIYDNADAPIAVPYSLPDAQILRLANWQIAMHEEMIAARDLSARRQ
jgi:hypothetical protein